VPRSAACERGAATGARVCGPSSERLREGCRAATGNALGFYGMAIDSNDPFRAGVPAAPAATAHQ
jgi:hypothetical protein